MTMEREKWNETLCMIIARCANAHQWAEYLAGEADEIHPEAGKALHSCVDHISAAVACLDFAMYMIDKQLNNNNNAKL